MNDYRNYMSCISDVIGSGEINYIMFSAEPPSSSDAVDNFSG